MSVFEGHGQFYGAGGFYGGVAQDLVRVFEGEASFYGAGGFYGTATADAIVVRYAIVEHSQLTVADFLRHAIIEQSEGLWADESRYAVIEHSQQTIPAFDRRGQLGQLILRLPDSGSGTGGGGVDTPDTPGGIDPVTGEEIVANFDRTQLPPLLRASAFDMPRGHQSWAHTGEGQFRASFSAGRTWEEEYALVRSSDPLHRSGQAYLHELAQNERVFEIDYPEYNSVTLGTIAGVATVAGGGQTGGILTSAGWTGTLKTGDIIRVDGINYTFDVIADVDSGVSFDIPINPPIRVGASPAAGAIINYGAAVRYRAKIDEIKNSGESGPDDIMLGLTVVYREVP